MGTDIHGPYIEEKTNLIEEDPWECRAVLDTPRWYHLYAELGHANGKSHGNQVEPIVPSRGVPEQPSFLWRKPLVSGYNHHDPLATPTDCRYISWLDDQEVYMLLRRHRLRYGRDGASIELVMWLQIMQAVHERKGNDTRLVFCFDN